MLLQRPIAAIALSTILVPAALAADARQPVKMPVPMQQHMLSNMRDHVRVLHEIHVALAEGKLDQAADVAEQRLGMSSLESHGAAHMAAVMPKEMQAIGTEMHRAASRFAVTVVEGDLPRSLKDLSRVTEQCVACHAAYRLE